MPLPPSNIILIGMPGSGKSAVGELLARRTGKAFVDTDRLIVAKTGKTLQEIVERDGHLALRRIEEAVLLGLECRDMVIATGGSAVYSEEAMAHLRRNGTVVYLKVGLRTIEARLGDYGSRGLAKRPDQALKDLFRERLALYANYAGVTIDGEAGGPDEVCRRIIDALRSPEVG